MDDGEYDGDADEQQRELVRQATGVLIARYGMSSGEAESALMDWSRVTGAAVFTLAERLVADAGQGTPDPQGARNLLLGVSAGRRPAQSDVPGARTPDVVRARPGGDLWERAHHLRARTREIGLGLAETADRVARTYDALADGRERRATRRGDVDALGAVRATRAKAEAERDEAKQLRRVFGPSGT